MPREFVILSADMPGDAVFRAAATAIAGEEVAGVPQGISLALDRGGLLARFHTPGVNSVLTVLHPRRVSQGEELSRLLPAMAPLPFAGPPWWTEAVAPWGAAGDLGERLANELAGQLGGVCVRL